MPVLIAFSSFLAIMSFALYIGQRKASVGPEARLQRHQVRVLAELGSTIAPMASAPFAEPQGAAPKEPLVKRALAIVARWMRPRLSATYRESVDRQLLMAGGMGGLQALQFVAMRISLALIVPALLSLLAGGRMSLLLLFAMTGLAWVLPDFYLKQRITARQKAIQKALPDVIDLLTVSVEAGLGLDAAITRVAEKITGPLGDEFRHYLRLVRMGTPRREAMRELGERSGVVDLRTFTTGIIQADQLGVSMGNVLRVQSEEMRRKRRQRAEEAAMKAPIKMLFPLVFFIFPTIFIVLLGPAGITLIQVFTQLMR